MRVFGVSCLRMSSSYNNYFTVLYSILQKFQACQMFRFLLVMQKL